MSLLRALHSRLSAEAVLTELVSDRIYFGNAPQNITADQVVLRHGVRSPEHVMRGRGGCATVTSDVHCLSATYLGAERLAYAVQAAIDGKILLFDGQKYVVEVESDEELSSVPPAGKSTPVAYGRTLSLRVFQTESR